MRNPAPLPAQALAEQKALGGEPAPAVKPSWALRKLYLEEGQAEKEPTVGRPRIWNRDELLLAIDEYTEATPLPILKEFCTQVGIISTTLNHWPEFKQAIKKLMEKKEAALERGLVEGKINAPAGIFSLKQFGWKDTAELTVKDGLDDEKTKQIDAELERIMAQKGQG